MRVLSATKALEALRVYRSNWSATLRDRSTILGRSGLNDRRASREGLRRGLREGLRLETLENRVVFSGASTLAVNDLYEAIVDEPLQVETGGVLANDIDAEGDDLRALEFFSPKHGELELNEDGTFVYTPEPGFTGIDGFVYQVDDGTSSSALAAVTIEVADPNIAPTGENDFYSLEEDSVLTVLAENGVLVNDQDENGDTLSVEVMDPPQNGSLELQADGSFQFTPDVDFHGTDAFTYRITDGSLSSDLVAVELQVTAVNDAPTATGEAYTMDEDGLIEAQSGALLANDLDNDSDDLTVILEQGPTNGALELDADGGFRYQPGADFHGTDQFTYRVSDGEIYSEAVTVDITVNAVMDLPQANNDFVETSEDSSLLILAEELKSNDEMGELAAASIVLADMPENGDLQVDENGNLTFTPDADFHGTDAFTYRLGEGDTLSDLAVVEIEIQSVNDTPVSEDDAFETDAGESIAISPEQLLANDSDPDGDSLTLEIIEGPTYGTLTQSDSGEWIYQADEGYVGPDEFRYSISDGQESSVSAVMLNVVAKEVSMPTAINEAYSIERGGVLSVAPDAGLLANESGDTMGPLELILFRGPQNGMLEWNPDGSFSYTPNDDFVGIDSILYRTSMEESASRLAVATLYVTEPEIAPESDEVANEEAGDGGIAEIASSQVDAAPAEDTMGEIALEETTNDPHQCWDSIIASGEDFWLEIRGVFS